MTVKEKLLNKLVNKHMPRRYYGHEARKYAKIIAIEYATEAIKDLSENKFNPDDYECLAGVCPDLSDEEHCETCTLKRLKNL
ncbi:hypothetical protein DSECCO2_197550 [anaerobic digester metagenome]